MNNLGKSVIKSLVARKKKTNNGNIALPCSWLGFEGDLGTDEYKTKWIAKWGE